MEASSEKTAALKARAKDNPGGRQAMRGSLVWDTTKTGVSNKLGTNGVLILQSVHWPIQKPCVICSVS